MKKILVTGSAGFIGFHMAKALLEEGLQVVGLDGLTSYYDPKLKADRHAILSEYAQFTPAIQMLEDQEALLGLMERERPDVIIHLAAQAGVRYSIDAPESYVSSNLLGGFHILEAAKLYEIKHLLFASTSSVYGANKKMPFAENDPTRTQMSFYAATKKSNEAMAHSYAHLYHIPTTMFRFFTVYGPWGRPDMALFKFTKAILEDQPIDIYNHGELSRDFTYIDDIISAIRGLMDVKPQESVVNDSKSPIAPWRVVNIGNSKPIQLLDFIASLERALGKKAIRNYLPMQKGDVFDTWADTSLLKTLTNVEAQTDLDEGIDEFVAWYQTYY